MPWPVTRPMRAGNFLDRHHQGIAEQHGPADAEAELRAGLAVGSDARRIVVRSAGDETGAEPSEKAFGFARLAVLRFALRHPRFPAREPIRLLRDAQNAVAPEGLNTTFVVFTFARSFRLVGLRIAIAIRCPLLESCEHAEVTNRPGPDARSVSLAVADMADRGRGGACAGKDKKTDDLKPADPDTGESTVEESTLGLSAQPLREAGRQIRHHLYRRRPRQSLRRPEAKRRL